MKKKSQCSLSFEKHQKLYSSVSLLCLLITSLDGLLTTQLREFISFSDTTIRKFFLMLSRNLFVWPFTSTKKMNLMFLL